MKIRKSITLLVSAVCITAATPAVASDSLNLTPYAGVGTLGVNVGLRHDYSESMSVRAGLNTFKYDADFDEGETKYEGDLTMRSFELMADWRPFKNGFHLTAGLLYNGNEVDVTARSNGAAVEIDGVNYSGANAVARFEGRLDKDRISPYIGIGYTSKPAMAKGLQFYANLGVIHQDIDTKLSVTGFDDPTGTLNESVRRANAELQDEADKIKFYPVANIGVAYAF